MYKKIVFPVLFTGLILFYCQPLPLNPFENPKNAKGHILLVSSNGVQNETSISDTAGNNITIKVIKEFGKLIDSVIIAIKFVDGNSDTTWVLADTGDTVSIKNKFLVAGLYNVELTVYAQQGYIFKDDATISIIPFKTKIEDQTQIITVEAGDSVVLFIKVKDVIPANYKWCRGGTELNTKAKDTLTIRNVTVNDTGMYQCIVTYSSGITDSNGSIHVYVKAKITKPVLLILRSPVPQLLAVQGSSVRLSVYATGNSPLKYQWFKNIYALNEKTDSLLMLTNITIQDSGVYYCRVIDSLDSQVTTTPCTLSVVTTATAPTIQDNPKDINGTEGQPLTLTVTASGTNLKYAWYKNKAVLENQSYYVLTISSFTSTDTGDYYAMVYNGLDTVNSDIVHVGMSTVMYEVKVSAGVGGKVTPSGEGGIVNAAKESNKVFTFTPDTGYRIKEVNVDNVKIDSAASSGNFQFVNVISAHTLSVTYERIPSLSYTLNVSYDSLQGSVAIVPKMDNYPQGTKVTLTPEPKGIYRFVKWSGDTTVTVLPLVIIINKNINVTAMFEVDTGARAVPISPNASLYAEIKKGSGLPVSMVVIAPAEGKYEQNTVAIIGKILFPIKRR